MGGRLPNLFIVGAMKAGSTSLYRCLAAHPDIFMSPVKEPNFFSTDIDPNSFRTTYKVPPVDRNRLSGGDADNRIHIAYIRDWNDYLSLYRDATEESVVGEASTSYLYSKAAPENIKNRIPDAKIIIILRDPVERAYSHYLMDYAIGRTRSSFIDSIRDDYNRVDKKWGRASLYIELGLYYEQVCRYLHTFSHSNIAIYLYEDWRDRPQVVLSNMAEFLSVEPGRFGEHGSEYNVPARPRFSFANYILHRSNMKGLLRKVLPSGVHMKLKDVYYTNYESRIVSDSERIATIDYFEKDIKKLEQILGRNLSMWLVNK